MYYVVYEWGTFIPNPHISVSMFDCLTPYTHSLYESFVQIIILQYLNSPCLSTVYTVLVTVLKSFADWLCGNTAYWQPINVFLTTHNMQIRILLYLMSFDI